ncbi:MAG: flagellar hook-length control protein FliK [Sedimentisphaerales bacterium]|nr:flagellar hook-length control protein FliK [Sedimentisphaerales bacterium]
MDVKTIKNQSLNWPHNVARNNKIQSEQGVFEAIFTAMQQTSASSHSSSASKTDRRDITTTVEAHKQGKHRADHRDEDIQTDVTQTSEQTDYIDESEQPSCRQETSTSPAESATPQDEVTNVSESEDMPQGEQNIDQAAESSVTLTAETTITDGQGAGSMLPDTMIATVSNEQAALTTESSQNAASPQSEFQASSSSVSQDNADASVFAASAEIDAKNETAAAQTETVQQGQASTQTVAFALGKSVVVNHEATDEFSLLQKPAANTVTQTIDTKDENAMQATVARLKSEAIADEGDHANEETAFARDNDAGQRQKAPTIFFERELKVEGETSSSSGSRQTAAETSARNRAHRQEQSVSANDTELSDASTDMNESKTVKTTTGAIAAVTIPENETTSAAVMKANVQLTDMTSSLKMPASEAKSTEPQTQRNIEEIIKSAQTAVARHSSRIQLRLDPPELGMLRVEIRSGRDGLQLQMQATTVKAQELLRQHSSELKAALEQQGLPASRIDIQLRMDLHENSSHSSSEQQHGGRQSASQQQQGQFGREMHQQPQGQTDGRSHHRETAFANAPGANENGWREMDFTRLDVTV